VSSIGRAVSLKTCIPLYIRLEAKCPTSHHKDGAGCASKWCTVCSPNQNEPAGICRKRPREGGHVRRERREDNEREDVANEGSVGGCVDYERATPAVCSTNQNEPAGICRIRPRERRHVRVERREDDEREDVAHEGGVRAADLGVFSHPIKTNPPVSDMVF